MKDLRLIIETLVKADTEGRVTGILVIAILTWGVFMVYYHTMLFAFKIFLTIVNIFRRKYLRIR